MEASECIIIHFIGGASLQIEGSLSEFFHDLGDSGNEPATILHRPGDDDGCIYMTQHITHVTRAGTPSTGRASWSR